MMHSFHKGTKVHSGNVLGPDEIDDESSSGDESSICPDDYIEKSYDAAFQSKRPSTRPLPSPTRGVSNVTVETSNNRKHTKKGYYKESIKPFQEAVEQPSNNNNRKQQGHYKESKPFNEVPILSLVFRLCLEAIRPMWNGICAVRWVLCRSLNTAILPCCAMPLVYPLKYIPHITLGEIIFLVPLAILSYASYDISFNQGDVEESGFVAELPLAAVFLLANKANSIITFALGIPYERLIFWHKLWTIVAVVTGGFHCWCAFVNSGDDRRRHLLDNSSVCRLSSDSDSDDKDGNSQFSLNGGANSNFFQFCMENFENTTGSLTLLAMLALSVSSTLPLRRCAFVLWYYSHIIFAIVAGVAAVMHETTTILFVLGWWVVDLAARYILMAGFLYPSKATLRALPGEIVELSFPKPAIFEYDAGQYVRISLPKLGFADFHPFSISSSPHQDTVTVHIRVLGSWTRRLRQLAEKESEVSFLMEGPYGRNAVDIDNYERYKMALFFSGGIGVTPMYSIANTLMHQVEQGGRRNMKKLRFVWGIRNMDLYHAMADYPYERDLCGPTILDHRRQQSNSVMDLDVYLTGNDTTSDYENNPLRPKLGRPNIDKIFHQMKEGAVKEGETSVAVFACGPTALMDSVRDACRRHSGSRVGFDSHEETFDL